MYGALPFFSLHFNPEGMQYPIVHPIYQNTLVGMIILELDLFMKNFLHGGDISGSEKWMHDHEEIPHLLRQNREALQKVKIEINKMEGSIEKIQAEINRIKKEGPEKSIDEVGYTSESYDRYLSRLSVPREIYEKEAIKYHDAVERYNGLVDREKMLSQQLGYKEKITLEKLQKKYGYIDFHDVQRDFESLDDKKRKVVLKSEKDMEIKRLLKLDQEVAREEKEEDLTQHNVKAADHIYPFHLRGVGMSEDHWIHNFFAAYDEFQIITKCIIPVFDDNNPGNNFKTTGAILGKSHRLNFKATPQNNDDVTFHWGKEMDEHSEIKLNQKYQAEYKKIKEKVETLPRGSHFDFSET